MVETYQDLIYIQNYYNLKRLITPIPTSRAISINSFCALCYGDIDYWLCFGGSLESDELSLLEALLRK